MKIRFRTKLYAIAGIAALAFVILLIAGIIVAHSLDDRLAKIEQLYVPKLELGPKLDVDWERLTKGFQDAVAAHDEDTLAQTQATEKSFFATLDAAKPALDPADIQALHDAMNDYYSAAVALSQRLIAGETGEDLTIAIAGMQAKQKRVSGLLKTTTVFDRDDLAHTFTSLHDNLIAAGQQLVLVTLLCLALMIVVSSGLGRSVVRSLNTLTAGFTRFGQGVFDVPIAVVSDDELGDVARQANVMAQSLKVIAQHVEQEKERVEEGSRLKSEFLANMSHELRTPLNAIIGFAELIYDGAVQPEMPEYKEFLNDILISARHLLQLINDVLDLSKVEAGKVEFRAETVDLKKLVGEVTAIVRTISAAKRITIDIAIAPEVNALFVDGGRLKQVLYNYLSNALKFTPAGGRISIQASLEAGDRVRLEVQDSGIGISPEDLQKLFVEFQQLDAGADKKHAGTGLGLALTKKLIEAQGGSVGVRSKVGEGSVFYVILPMHAQPGVALPAPQSFPAASADTPTILVVEDNPEDQASLVRTLRDAGYAVETALNGAQAIAKCDARTFDAITLDLLLPDVSGLDVLRKIRSGGKNQNVPVVVVTVVAEEGSMAGCAVHECLAKPLDGPQLLVSLQRAGVAPERSGKVLVVDDNAGSLRLMAATLANLGYQATCADSGDGGLRAAAEEPPLAVILDLLMPGMDGLQFLAHFRKMPACQRIPVLIWTVQDLSSEEYMRFAAETQGVLSKGQGNKAVLDELRLFLPAKRA